MFGCSGRSLVCHAASLLAQGLWITNAALEGFSSPRFRSSRGSDGLTGARVLCTRLLASSTDGQLT